MNNTGAVDIIEVFLKKDLDIPLTELEENWYNNMDDETKQSVFELVNNYSYIEELVKVMNKIKEKSTSLPIEEQQLIHDKCKKREEDLEKMNYTQPNKRI